MSPKKTTGLTDHNVRVGLLLKIRRVELKMSQQELAQQIGVAFQQVQKYEKGINGIPVGRLVQIAEILSVPASYFLPAIHAQPISSEFSKILSNRENLHWAKTFSQIQNADLRAVLLRIVERLVELN